MNQILLRIVAAGFCFAIGHTLKCNKCDLAIFNLCFPKTITCADGELCFSGVGKAAGFVDIKTKGCLAQSQCNQTESVSFPPNSNTSIYSIYKACCSGDLCNSAPGLPRLSILPLAFATFTTVFLTKALV